jgi:nucleoside-diphosphate-sugar epimerase
MRLFLTGATGFVGRNLLLAALNGGLFEEIVVSVRDRAKLARQLADEGFPELPPRLRIFDWQDAPPADVTHAVHCAGVLFARDRAEYFRVNVEDTLRLLGGLPKSARILVLSSQSAGGPTPSGRETRTSTDPDAPLTWYGESKLAMERALAGAHPGIRFWRPPMILGPRDRATLPLFQMAAGPLRIKPGLRAKSYSWIAVSDLVRAILCALRAPAWPTLSAPLPVCAPETISDLELIATAAAVTGRKGVVLPLPHPLVRVVSLIVDAAPPLRAAAPSLTRDRAREIFPDRWVLDGSAFHRMFADGPFATLRDTLAETRAWYVRAGLLPAA